MSINYNPKLFSFIISALQQVRKMNALSEGISVRRHG